MQIGYTKLFSKILDSTIWLEDNDTRIVWITMLAMCDYTGKVEGSARTLANRARVSVESCQKALDKFLAPEADSQTTEHEGRRISVVDGGWQLLNHAKYRRMMSEEHRREYKRLKAQEYRAKDKSNGGLDGRPASAAYKSREQAELAKHSAGIPSDCD